MLMLMRLLVNFAWKNVGDSEEKIEERIKNDREAFADVDSQHWDCIIRNSRHSDLSVIAMKLNDVIKSFESREE